MLSTSTNLLSLSSRAGRALTHCPNTHTHTHTQFHCVNMRLMGNSKVNRLCHGFMHACAAPTVSLSTTRKTTPANTFHAACRLQCRLRHQLHHTTPEAFLPLGPSPRTEVRDKSICHWPRGRPTPRSSSATVPPPPLTLLDPPHSLSV